MKKRTLSTILVLMMVFSLFTMVTPSASAAAKPFTLPNAQSYSVPEGYEIPVSKTGYFNPNVSGDAVLEGAPIIFSYTKTAGPDESISLTGANITENTRFVVFAQRSSSTVLYLDAKIQNIEAPTNAVITLPERSTGLSWSTLMVWAINDVGASRPMLINKTEAWWVGPEINAPGDTASLMGTNLSSNNAVGGKASIYIESTDKSYKKAVEIVSVAPDKIDFVIPSDIPLLDTNSDGVGELTQFNLWVHNGSGGDYGWSTSYFKVQPKQVWNNTIINVKNYGAVGDGVANDTAAIRAALAATDTNSDGTQGDNNNLYFPAGTYLVYECINIPGHLRLYGDGKSESIIKMASLTSTTLFAFPNQSYLEFADITLDCYSDENLAAIDWGSIDYGSYFDSRGALYGANNQFMWFKNVDIKSPKCGMAFAGFFGLGGNHIFFDGCSITTARIGIGANNLFFRNTTLLGQASNPWVDAEMILDPWGSNKIFISNCHVADKDPVDDGVSKEFAKRFYRDNCVWGSGTNIYISDNNIDGIGPHSNTSDFNSGEIILFESANGKKMGTPTAATSNTVTFNQSIIMPGKGSYVLQWSGELCITSGKGVGQRKGIWCDDSQANSQTPTLQLGNNTWDIIPDSTSTMVLTVGARYISIRRNTISGLLDYNDRSTASTAINAFESVHDMTITDNTIYNVGSGVTLFTIWEQGNDYANTSFIAMLQDNLIANNTIKNTKTGIFLASVDYAYGGRGDDGIDHYVMYGNVFRNNRISDTSSGSFGLFGDAYDNTYTCVFENNTCTNSPAGINLQGGTTVVGRYLGGVYYKNKFSPGTSSDNSSFVNYASLNAATGLNFNFAQNTITGFEAVQGSNLIGSRIQVPERHFDILSTSTSQITIPVWSAGLTGASYTASTGDSWISLDKSSGSVAVNSTDAITVTCNPSTLTADLTSGTVTITDGVDTFTVFINFYKGDNLVTWDAIKGTNTENLIAVKNLNLVTDLNGVGGTSVSWTSSDQKVISPSGVVNRYTTEDKTVTLRANVVCGTHTFTYSFVVTVPKYDTQLLDWNNFKGTNISMQAVTENLNLISSLPGYPESTITWSTSDATVVTNTGIVNRTLNNDKTVVLTATIQHDSYRVVQDFSLTVAGVGNDPYMKGDVNCDGNITIVDALFIFKHISGKAVLPSDSLGFSNADVDNNQTISITDALAIFKHISGKQIIA